MVIKVCDYQGKFHCDGHIFVPNKWYNIENCPLKNRPQWQAINNEDKLYSNQHRKNSNNDEHKLEISKKYINYPISETSENGSSAKDDKCQTEELWTKQFSRWWSWNWQRKRKLLLSKFGMCQRNYLNEVNSKHQKEERQKKINIYEVASKQKRADNVAAVFRKTDLTQSNVGQLHQPIQFTYNKNMLGPTGPIPQLCSNRLEEPCKSRRMKNKKNERIYEGWMREVRSSDSNFSDITESMKINKPKKITNNEKLHYLSLRLRKLNSCEFILREKKKTDECKKSKINSNILSETKGATDYENNKSKKYFVHKNTKDNNCKKPKINYQSNDDHKKTITEYISPITGQHYDATLHKIIRTANETNEAEIFNSVTVADLNFIPSRDYNWMENFQLMKREHKNFLDSINKAMGEINHKNSSINFESNNATDFNIRNWKSENSIKTKYYGNDGNLNDNMVEVPLPTIVQTEIISDEKNINPVKSKVIETICFKQIQGYSSSTNLRDYYNENYIEDTKADYDLNYISNHIDSFSSLITDTSFIINRLDFNYDEEFSAKCEHNMKQNINNLDRGKYNIELEYPNLPEISINSNV